jgi:hypothetical protein
MMMSSLKTAAMNCRSLPVEEDDKNHRRSYLYPLR